ncbi:type II toxin-antitoxin system RelB/DinJ family antitoxin [Photorhabdus bodei]|uniref:Type II toxin-antitoxin system RelB/DinJ family antitoxin n=1 Tax=Photorhabdus bodei TaxID=2029681 RepID=A0AAW6BKM7_9GAMM|nr:type II toxin-antitoxin system RelB/DinJ family antitoxin [Photorhabdus bodei]MDB6373293.1 type II toxin-antitoxin system RelB/DinJ family antitoxin [Photorhabdus bodei]
MPPKNKGHRLAEIGRGCRGISSLINRLAIEPELPVELLQLNQETLQAIRDLENGVGVHRVNTIDELKRDFGW